MKRTILIPILAALLFLSSCEEKWQEEYYSQDITVDINLWDAIKEKTEFSEFVSLANQFNLDTIFIDQNIYTVFVPDNQAIEEYKSKGEITSEILEYHIINHLIQSKNIKEKRKVETITEKFAFFEGSASGFLFDEIKATFESPLYLNGKYYSLSGVAKPKPNLFEYFSEFCPPLKNYIENLDSVLIDKEKSEPKGFDVEGNIIYDTVAIIYNPFEEEFFPVREEYRNRTATVVFPKEKAYNGALDEMALKLGGNFVDHNSIPNEWEQNVLIPYLLERGVFNNIIEPEEFEPRYDNDTIRLKNIIGDSVDIDYNPVDRFLCSNGVYYNYNNFVVPDSLFRGNVVFEAEWLLEETGIDKYNWFDFVTVQSGIALAPRQDYIPSASNDTIISVVFPNGYESNYSVAFNGEYLFPGKYRVIVATHMDYGGIYNIYVNDELVKTFDYYDFIRYTRLGTTVVPSVTGNPQDRFVNNGRFNKFDFFVDNIYDYQKPRIRFEYAGPGEVPNNGFFLDNIEFIPYN